MDFILLHQRRRRKNRQAKPNPTKDSPSFFFFHAADRNFPFWMRKKSVLLVEMLLLALAKESLISSFFISPSFLTPKKSRK
jgi:hypothetical protein